MKQVEFEVIGMHCVSCSMGIRKLVQKLKTVDQADVELGT
ncbi:MAG: cation transporter, partial [Bacillota bacterium]